MLRRSLMALCSLFALGAGQARAQSVYSFGDSLSDTGNVKSLTFGAQAGEDLYWRGRFSNGPVWNDHVALAVEGREQRTNPQLIGPFSRTTDGFNFAHGGAVSGYDSLRAEDALGFEPPEGLLRIADAFVLLGQADHFRDQKVLFGPRVFRTGPGDIATISIGGNDYLNGRARPETVTPGVITSMDMIRQRGVSRFLVLDLPRLGELPSRIEGPEREQLNADTLEHNALLTAGAADFAARTGAAVEIVPLSALFDAILIDADTAGGARFGFTNVRPDEGTRGNCLDDGLILEACPASYLFYDGRHPTAAMHALIGDLALARLNAASERTAAFEFRREAALAAAGALDRLITARLDQFATGALTSGAFLDGAGGAGVPGGLGFAAAGGAGPAASGGFSAFSFSTAGAGFAASDRPTPGLRDDGFGVSAWGLDWADGPALALGFAALRSDADREGAAAQRRGASTAFAAYGVIAGDGGRLALRLAGGRTSETLNRRTGFAAAPTATARAESSFVSARLDGRRTLIAGAFGLDAIGKASVAQLDLGGYRETAALAFIADGAPARRAEGAAGYLGLSAHGDLRLGAGWRGAVAFEAGGFAASSSALGFRGLRDAAGFDAEAAEPDFFAPERDEARTAGLLRVRLGIAHAAGLTLDAEASTLTGTEDPETAGSVRARWRW